MICSRVDTALSSKELAEKFPKYLEAKQRGAELSVTLNAGEMLYLPAGWFHEVRSVGAPPEGHMAVNFWFHPPDSDRFDAPYADDFWKKDWELRLQAMKGSNSTM
jgi:ribosomal protein L16 Arg81 hydroxylase